MTYFIKVSNRKFYVVARDTLGNLYDTMHHFTTRAKANEFIEEMNTFDQAFDSD